MKSTPSKCLKEVSEEDSSGRKADKDSDSVETPAGNVDERSPTFDQQVKVHESKRKINRLFSFADASEQQQPQAESPDFKPQEAGTNQ